MDPERRGTPPNHEARDTGTPGVSPGLAGLGGEPLQRLVLERGEKERAEDPGEGRRGPRMTKSKGEGCPEQRSVVVAPCWDRS